MFSWLKKYFIPHEENEFRPHFFRRDSVVFSSMVLVGLFLLLILGSDTLIKSNYFAAIFPRALVSYTNETRKDVLGGGNLAINTTLEEAARMKAEDMAKNGYFAHTSPDGKTPWYWLDQAGYNFKYAGENLAVNFIDSIDVQNAWMASPSHKENILNPNFKEIGIATATGTYQGKEAIFVVEFFGTPAASKSAADVIKTAAAAESGRVTSTAEAEQPVSIAVSGAKEGQISGAFQENTQSLFENAAASPKAGLIRVYVVFIALILISIFTAVTWELRRHHISIWVNGFVLLTVAFALIVSTMHFQLGIPHIL